MKKIVIQPKPIKFFSQIKNAKFTVPEYQRFYDWSVNLVEMFINDIVDHIGKEDLYLGELICKKVGKNEFVVIDGQQRLVTLTILFRVLRKSGLLTKAKNEFIDKWFRTTIFHRHGINLNERKRQQFFHKIVWSAEGDILPEDKKQKYYTNIINAYEKLEEKVGEFDRKKANECYKFLMNNIEIVFVKLSKATNEAEIFEDINSKRLTLSAMDLIKSFLLSECSATAKNEFSQKWDCFFEGFVVPDKEPKVFLNYFLSLHLEEEYRNKNIYEDFKKFIYEEKYHKEPLSVIDALLRYQKYYLEILHLKGVEGKGKKAKRLRSSLACLNYLGFKSHVPLLLKLRSTCKLEKLLNTIELIEVVQFLHTDVLKEDYPQDIKDTFYLMMKEKGRTLNDIVLEELRLKYSEYKRNIKGRLESMHNKKSAQRYVVYRILKASPTIKNELITDYDDSSIEHIIPEEWQSNQIWKAAVFKDLGTKELRNETSGMLKNKKIEYFNKRYVQGLGNWLLLALADNSGLQNESFSVKKEKVYIEESSVNIAARYIRRKKSWKAEYFKDYGKWLSNQYLKKFDKLIKK